MRLVESDMRYYRQRYAEERERAAAAACKEAGAVHRDLAALYQERLQRSEEDASR